MLNKVDVYSSSQLASELILTDGDSIDTDLIQVTNIDGLDPVTASIDVVSSGNVDGAISLDSQVPTRNIVMTLRPNPDWVTWTIDTLRQLIYSYFIPKSTVRLVFDSDEIDDFVEISGTVESCELNLFSKDPEYVISIICPDPYFTKVTPNVITGSIISPGNFDTLKETIHIAGNIPIGIEVKLPDGFSTEVFVQAGNPGASTFHVIGSVSGIFAMGSIPLFKYIRSINPENGSFVNFLDKLEFGSKWPVLVPGNNSFAVMGVSVGNVWELTYSEKYGGL